ncbi:MAG: acyl-ACP--UDP-N-acetylglucosamine O-acyltransferase [Gammaproteobacteria bacterium]
MVTIHPTALVDPDAQLAEGVMVGPFAVIEKDVSIGPECRIGAHAVVKRYSRLGRRNTIHEHAIIGGDPQDLSFKPCVSYVSIGDDNVIREGVSIHRATREGAATSLGDGNFLMANAHVAHDCKLANLVVLANSAALGGHVSVGDRAFISANAAVHQFCRIGRIAMISGLAGVNMDCLPFTLATGAPARVVGLNRVGLQRAGVNAQEISALKRAYQLLFLSRMGTPDALAELASSPFALVREWGEFIAGSTRGFARQRG